MTRPSRGFTIVEMVIIITVLAILAAIAIIGYGAWRQSIAKTSVQSDLQHATNGLKSYQNFKNDYPPNLGGVDFAPSDGVSLRLSTNAKQVRKYGSGALNADQNAYLFINSCNSIMPIVEGSTVYNGSCTISGINLHVKGVQASNENWKGPEITQDEIILTCGGACTAAVQQMIDAFLAQGGTFPLMLPKGSVEMPAYDVAYSEGPATRFCLEAVSVDYEGIVYHTTSESSDIAAGPCPADAELHYP